MTRTLDRDGQLALMRCTGACYAAGQDLSALRHIAAESCDILVVDVLDLIYTEAAYLATASVTHRSISHGEVSFRDIEMCRDAHRSSADAQCSSLRKYLHSNRLVALRHTAIPQSPCGDSSVYQKEPDQNGRSSSRGITWKSSGAPAE